MKAWKCLAVLALALTLAAPASASEIITDQNLARVLRKMLQEQPDLVLEVLRQNSEAILDIAQQGSNIRRKRVLERQWREDMKEAKSLNIENRPVRGPENAPVTIVAFSDFTCPYCQQGSETIRRVLKDYGKNVHFVFKHMPLGKDSLGRLASEYFIAAALQDADKAWQLHDLLFSERQRLATEGEAFLREAVKSLGLDARKLAADVRSRKVRSVVDADLADAQRLGVEGTPCFYVNDLVVRGALSYDLFRSAVELALSQNKKAK